MGVTNFDKVQLDGDELLDSAGKKILADQQGAIADVTPAADGTSAGTAVNAILAVLRAHGLIATAE